MYFFKYFHKILKLNTIFIFLMVNLVKIHITKKPFWDILGVLWKIVVTFKRKYYGCYDIKNYKSKLFEDLDSLLFSTVNLF